MQFPQSRILIFAKTPIAGQVKTRLISTLGATAATELYRRMLSFLFTELTAAKLCPIQGWWTPDIEHPFVQESAKRFALDLHVQQGGDLGERMARAVTLALADANSVVLVGGDCPLLKTVHLRQVLEWLADGQDAVLGPAEDGGYVLLGLRKYNPHLFQRIDWGSESVLDTTRERLRELELSWRELPALWDVDRPQDVKRLTVTLPLLTYGLVNQDLLNMAGE